MHVFFLRAKQVNQESLEEMECLAKMEFQAYQGSRCVCLFVCVCMCVMCCFYKVLVCVIMVQFVVQGIVGPPGQMGLKGEQGDSGPPGKVRSCRIYQTASAARTVNGIALSLLLLDVIPALQYLLPVEMEDIFAIVSCGSFDLITKRVVIFLDFLQGPESGFFYLSSWSFKLFRVLLMLSEHMLL